MLMRKPIRIPGKFRKIIAIILGIIIVMAPGISFQKLQC